MDLEWMAWTNITAGFFICIALMLAGMLVWQLKSPSIERKGLLPIPTTRGDRLFIGLLGSGFLTLTWIGLTEWSMWLVLPLVLIFMALVMRYG
jgi:predicted small integral membrane protein